ncbi:hypothetical protein LTR37_010759 [Vermiconidia calcicola]|uniref:Uncharacterized protein n=1 Tax=Vermiconidia calcicola TaxID=1690605 RepID=A0ACC3N5E5_9PEZI|nr:hypothetical protein LTR37_010759 [Vermiconidia calcicola]
MAETDPPTPTPTVLQRWSTLPGNIVGMLNPFSNDEDNESNPDATASPHQPNKKQSFLSSILPRSFTPEPPSLEKEDEIMFAEPETQSNSDVASREGSVAECGKEKSKKSSKAKTCYSICHPAPASTTRQKLHRRPRSLLQLHKLSPNARPQPAFEVVPSANFSVRLTKSITKVFRAKHGLCPNDLVVLRAEKYATDELDEDREATDIIALICRGRKEDSAAPGKAKICLPEGREWEAYPIPNGGYEFFSTDEHGLGLTVRWVPKKNKDGSKTSESGRKKFNFSTISPNSRRHPVIATLSKTGMDINDTYKMPEPSAATPLSTPKQASTFLTDAMDEESDGKGQCETDDRLRQIITMTGIWVTFKEGWSPYFKYEDKEKDCNGLQRSPSLQQSPSKAATFSSPGPTPPGSPLMAPLEKRNSMKSVSSNILRKGSLLGKGNRSSTVSIPEGDEGTGQPDASKNVGRSRADSASTVLVHRAASNRTKNNHQATWRPELLASQLEVSESPPGSVRHQSAPNTAVSFDVSPSPTPERRASIARPILPPSRDSGSGSENGNARSDGQPSGPEKRESSTTTNTTSTASEAQPAKRAAMPAKKKRGGWRRLLCGGGQDI